MNSTKHHSYESVLRQWLIPFLMGVTLFLVIGCAIPGLGLNAGNSNSLATGTAIAALQAAIIQTEGAVAKAQSQATLDTQRATLNAQETSLAAQQVQATLNVQIATLNAQGTALNVATATTAPPIAAQPSSAPTNATTLETVALENWKLFFFVKIPNGCRQDGLLCLKLNDDWKQAQASNSTDGYILSTDSVLIDSAWPRPYLVFWHKRLLRQSGHLEIQADSRWQAVRDYSNSSSDWAQEALDLKEFKGKEVRVRLTCVVGYYKQSEWLIEEVQIVPNYRP